MVNLSYIKRLKKFSNNIIGYSDHTKVFQLVCAVAMGAKIIEKHITISRYDKAPDSFFSIEQNDPKTMEKLLEKLKNLLVNQKDNLLNFSNAKARRSYYSQRNLKGGNYKRGDFKALRPYVKYFSADKYFKFLEKLKNIKPLSPLKSDYL